MILPPSLDLSVSENLDEIVRTLKTHKVLAVSIQFHKGTICKSSEEIAPNITVQECTDSVTMSMIMALQSKQKRATILQSLHCRCFKAPIINQVAELLRLRVPYVGYDMVGDICWLQYLNLPVPPHLWDIRAAARFLSLGKININARTKYIRDQQEQIESRQTYLHRAKQRLEMHAIAGSCGLKIGIQSPLLIQLRIYQAQKDEMKKLHCLDHFSQVEMPWQQVVADLQYHGVRIDPTLHKKLLAYALQDCESIGKQLQEYGIYKPGSRDNTWRVLQSLDLHHFFFTDRSCTSFSLNDDQLECHKDKHPMLRLLKRHRKVRNLISFQQKVSLSLTPQNTIHPIHVQMGTETGRQTCHSPNLLGFDRIQRNLVVPKPGYGIAEVDYSQHEVGIVAGLYRDQHLIRLYNSGDVYTRIAQSFYANRPEIAPGAEKWPEGRFREKYPHLRTVLKTVILAVLYGQEAYGLARRLAISIQDAEAFLCAFQSMFPELQQRMESSTTRAMQTGYVELINGVRIAMDNDHAIAVSARRRHARNYPVQGSGAIVFKTAGIRLKPLYEEYDARLLVPMHDAFIFQAPLEILDEVAEATSREMIHAMKMYFPDLEPKVSTNTKHPQCWVKSGYEDALKEYLGTPILV